MYEVEIKYKIENVQKIKEILLENGCSFTEKAQNDYVYVHKDVDGLNVPNGENILRVRKEDNNTYITLKKRGSSLELETKIEDAKTMLDIFKELKYKKLAEVIKTREETQYNGFNITLDNVEKLGNFIEIEMIINNECKENETLSKIKEFAKKLSLYDTDIVNDKYDKMLYRLESGKTE